MSSRNTDKKESTSGWIYIGADCEKLNWCKVGKTDGDLRTRHRSAQNPNFFIYGAFKIKAYSPLRTYSKKILGHIEKSIHEQLRDRGNGFHLPPIRHFSTGSDSECYRVNPETMMGYVEGILIDSFYYYVSINSHDVISENYRFPNNHWWKRGHRYDFNKPTGMIESLLGERPASHDPCPNYRRKGVNARDGYSTQSITPLTHSHDNVYLDPEDGEYIDFDEYEDDDEN